MGTAPSPEEGLLVLLDGGAVQLEGFLDRRQRDRDHAALPGGAKQNRVGENGVAHQADRQLLRIEEPGVVFATGFDNAFLHAAERELPVRVAGEFGGRRFRRIDYRPRLACEHLRHRFATSADHEVAANDGMCLAGGNACGVDVGRLVGDAQVRKHGAVFLRQPGHVEHRDALAIDVRRHADQCAERDNAGAAHPGDEDVERAARVRQCWFRQAAEHTIVDCQPFCFLQAATFHRDEGGAEALEAGKILVAGRLVDLALAAKLGFQWCHGQAVGLHAAIAAAFANGLVDEGAAGRINEFAALPAPALFGGAGLLVDQDRDAGIFAQFALHGVQLVAVMDRDRLPLDLCQPRHLRIFLRRVADDDDLLNAFAFELPRHLRHAQDAVHRLAAGHGHRVVVEDLVGDRVASGNGLPDRQQPRVEIGAVTEVGEDVLFCRKWRLTNPGHAFAAHVREGGRAAVHPGHHVVATNAGHCPRAFRHAGRGVVRATRAEGRRALGKDDRR